MGHTVVSGKYTWAETIQRNNDVGKVVLSNSSYNRLLLAKDNFGRFKPVPDDIARARPLYSGTAAAIGAIGRRWKSMEDECQVGEKTVHITFNAMNQQEAGVMLTIDHGFASDGTPKVGFYDKKDKLVKLYDAEGKQINEMPDRVSLRFNGDRICLAV